MPSQSFDIVIVGGGAAGIAVAASLLRRTKDLSIAIIEPADTHSYQPCLLYTSPSPRDRG